MIRLSLEVNIRGKAPWIIESLKNKMTDLMLELQQKIQREKLSGQVLHQRSGKLIASIRSEGGRVEGGTITGSVTGAGGPAWYGVVHEFGGKGPYEIKPVNKKALAFFPSVAGTAITKTELRKLYSGPMSNRSLKQSKYGEFSSLGGVVVKSVMHPAAKERSFMRSALEEMAPRIHSELKATIKRAITTP